MAISIDYLPYYQQLYQFNGKTNDLSNFILNESFKQKYNGKNPNWSVLSYITYKRTYSRYIESEQRTEEFNETLNRVIEGVFSIQKHYCLTHNINWNDEFAQIMAQEMYEMMWNFKFLPSGRSLWMMGTEYVIKHGSASLCNCGFISTEDIDIDPTYPFEFVMDNLMLGVGMGFDTKGKGKITIKSPNGILPIVITDNREGWIYGLKLLLLSFFKGEGLPIYDYSLIRKKGERIKGFGGISSGFEPLRDSFDAIKKLLEAHIGEKITSVIITDIMNYIGKCIVSGNIRRSAEIALGDSEDKAFMLMKQDEVALSDRRWASNNSVIAKRGMDYTHIAKLLAKNGEPAIVYLENAQNYSRMKDVPDYKDKLAMGVNPCGEQTLESGELCNLIETFIINHSSFQDYCKTLFFAYLYAKTITLIPTHWEKTNEIIARNRRLGISQSGIIDAYNKYGEKTILDWSNLGYEYLHELDIQFSNFFQITPSIKLTTIKPSGTVSLLAMVSSGIHYPHSKYYIRRIQFDETHDLLDILRKANYHIERSETTPNTMVVEFPVYESNFGKSKNDVTIWDQVANAVNYQRLWSDNQVSITITFKPHEIDQITKVLLHGEKFLKGMSLLPLNDHGYKQAPYEEITKDQYEKMVSQIKILEMKSIQEEGEGVLYCDGGYCKVTQ